MIKDILVKLESDKSRDEVFDYAISLAEKFDAHLTGVSFAQTNIPPFMMADVPSGVLQQIFAENMKVAQGSVDRFNETTRRRAVSAECRLISQSEFESSIVFSEMARLFDLSVVMQSEHHNGVYNEDIIEAALFDSGRPMIVIPYFQKEELNLNRVICCWDGSRAAARAVNDAIPLLKQANAVEILIVANEKNNIEHDNHGVEIGRHLARHGVKFEIEVVPIADIDVANVILSYAADCSANMIVMGGYGHSRLREFILGGVTRGILSTMTVPVFMSH